MFIFSGYLTMSSKQEKQKKKCGNFEPQLFRRNLCKNCFKTEAEHGHADDNATCSQRGQAGHHNGKTADLTTTIPATRKQGDTTSSGSLNLPSVLEEKTDISQKSSKSSKKGNAETCTIRDIPIVDIKQTHFSDESALQQQSKSTVSPIDAKSQQILEHLSEVTPHKVKESNVSLVGSNENSIEQTKPEKNPAVHVAASHSADALAFSEVSSTEQSKQADTRNSAKYKPSEQEVGSKPPPSNVIEGQVKEEASVPEQDKIQPETSAKKDDTSSPETKISTAAVITGSALHSTEQETREVKESDIEEDREQQNKHNKHSYSGLICDIEDNHTKKSKVCKEEETKCVTSSVQGDSAVQTALTPKTDVKETSAVLSGTANEDTTTQSTVHEDIPMPLTSGGRYYAGRDTYEEGETTFGAASDDELQRHHHDIYHLNAEDGQGSSRSSSTLFSEDGDKFGVSDFSNESADNLQQNNRTQVKRARGVRQVRRRSRSRDDSDFEATNLKLHTFAMDLDRGEAMMEGTRLLIDNLRDKLSIQEENSEHLEREKVSLQDLLSLRKNEYNELRDALKERIHNLEDNVKQLHSEKDRLIEKMKMPESERSSHREQEKEIASLVKKLEDSENRYSEALEDNESLRNEVRDLHLEMEEMHDQFREEEALEFRELQKELEATAKNCRILQFKLRKSERRNDQLEGDRIQYEDKIRQLESHFEASDDKQHIRELEEELKMAKEVSVRLHDELELVEEKRAR